MKAVSKILGPGGLVRSKRLWIMLCVLMWWIWPGTPSMVGIERLIDPGLMRVIQVDREMLPFDYSCEWLVEIDDPVEVERLMDRARQEGTNLATAEFVLDPAREFSPARHKDRFTKESEIIGMFFLQRKQLGPLFVDIVVSVDRKLVYFHVWGT